MDYVKRILTHYTKTWGGDFTLHQYSDGPMKSHVGDFRVLECAPSKSRGFWTYATCGMASSATPPFIELHLFSLNQDYSIVELLTAVAHWQITSNEKMDINHTINFGRPWKTNSNCNFGYISLPYLDGHSIEIFNFEKNKPINCYWLIPITEGERDFKKEFGFQKLEELFDDNNIDFINPFRKSLI